MGRHESAESLEQQVQAVLDLKDFLAAAGKDDPDILEMSISSETNFDEVMEHLMSQLADTRTYAAALKQRIADMKDRLERYETREENIKAMIGLALMRIGKKKFECPEATASLRQNPASLEIDPELEFDIPTKFYKQPPPVIDKAAIKKVLKDRETALEAAKKLKETDEEAFEAELTRINKELPAIPGAILKPGAYSITFSVK